MNRRNFLKMGTGSCAVLSAVSISACLTGCSEAPSTDERFRLLRPNDREFFTAIIPVVLKGSWPSDADQQSTAMNEIMINIDNAMFNLGPHNQKQMIDLFNLLNFTPSRGLTTGVWSAWNEASENDIEQFLNKWRDSSLGLLNLAYNGVSKLIIAIWFGMSQSWDKVGYPGPPFADILITKPS